MKYEDQDENLILSDIEKFQKIPEPKSVGSKTALILDFFLPTSTYATMALREILKIDPKLVAEMKKSKNAVEVEKSDQKAENGTEKRKIEDVGGIELEAKKLKGNEIVDEV